MIKTGDLRYEKVNFEEVSIRPYGDFAVIVAKVIAAAHIWGPIYLRFARETDFGEVDTFVVADFIDLSGLDPKHLSQMLCIIAVEFGTVVSNLRDKETSACHLLSLYPRRET